MAGPLREEDGQLVGPASVKALRMRGYDVDAASGSVEVEPSSEYATSSAFDNSAENLSYPAGSWSQEVAKPGIEALADQYNFKPTIKQMASTIASEAEWGKVLANQPKMIGEFFAETIPIARRAILPVDPFTDPDQNLSMGDRLKGMLYQNPIGYFGNLFTTDVKGKNFRKIARNQENENMLVPYIEKYIQDYGLTEDKFIDAANRFLGLDVVSMADVQRKYKGNVEVKDALHALKAEMGKHFLDENDWYSDDDNYYIKNFQEIPMGVNAAWTWAGDMQLPHLGIIKLDDEGQGSLISKSATSYEDIPILGEMQNKGYIGAAEDPHGMYQGMFGGDNPATQVASMFTALPAALATGNIRGIAAAPTIGGKVHAATRPFSTGISKIKGQFTGNKMNQGIKSLDFKDWTAGFQ